MIELGINIDHVATVRQARRTYEPDPVAAAAFAELGGADVITVHLREDRRHIIDRDVRILRQTVAVKYNLEMACSEEIVRLACEVKPDQVTLVPEKREEVTTEGGLDVGRDKKRIADVIERLSKEGIEVSLFLDPDFAQIQYASELGARAVELHTGQYALAKGDGMKRELDRLIAGGGEDSRTRYETPCWSWIELSKRHTRCGHSAYARTQYRTQHRSSIYFCGTQGSGGGDEETPPAPGKCQRSLEILSVSRITDEFRFRFAA